MCLFKAPKQADPVMPPEYAAQKAPTTQAAKTAGATLTDKSRQAAGTMLTGAGGVGASIDVTGKKTLLGA